MGLNSDFVGPCTSCLISLGFHFLIYKNRHNIDSLFIGYIDKVCTVCEFSATITDYL
jgi:hypothetical protein